MKMIGRVPASAKTAVKVAVVAGLRGLRDDYPQDMLAALIGSGGAVAAADAVDLGRVRRAFTGALAAVVPIYRHEAYGQAAAIGVLPAVDAEGWVTGRANMLAASSQAALYAVASDLQRRRTDPWTAADVMRRSVGLARPAALAAERVRLSGAPKTAVRVADRFADRHLSARAATIAATEPHAALVAGAVATWQQALPDDTTLVWDGGTCDVCAPYDGTTASLADGFDDGLPPLHVACGCVVSAITTAASAAA